MAVTGINLLQQIGECPNLLGKSNLVIGAINWLRTGVERPENDLGRTTNLLGIEPNILGDLTNLLDDATNLLANDNQFIG